MRLNIVIIIIRGAKTPLFMTKSVNVSLFIKKIKKCFENENTCSIIYIAWKILLGGIYEGVQN